MSVLLIPMWILSGAMFPLAGTWMEPLSIINPAAWVVEGFHYSLLFEQMNISKAQLVPVMSALLAKLFIFCTVVDV